MSDMIHDINIEDGGLLILGMVPSKEDRALIFRYKDRFEQMSPANSSLYLEVSLASRDEVKVILMVRSLDFFFKYCATGQELGGAMGELEDRLRGMLGRWYDTRDLGVEEAGGVEFVSEGEKKWNH